MDVDYSSFPSEFNQMDLVAMLMETEKPPAQELYQFSSSTVPASAFYPSSSAPSNGGLHDHMTTAAADITNSLHGRAHASAAAVREMVFRIAAMQPVDIDPASVRPPKRRNVRISKDPQSVAARHRRERISERIRILQRLVPGGTKMDTASMLEEAIHYLKFLKNQVQSLEQANGTRINPNAGATGFSRDRVNGRLSNGNCMLWGMNL